MHTTRFMHSFPRPKAGDSAEATLNKALSILALIQKVGLVLAPEVIEWSLSPLGVSHTPLQILQRRVCFTEIEPEELRGHAKSFGPIALSFDTAKLREAGAMPVIYVPQGLGSALSQIATFCVNGVYHTKAVLTQLQQLKEMSDPAIAATKFGLPVDPNYTLTLRNVDSTSKVDASYTVPSTHARQILQHVGFNNIPFDHSIGVLAIFLNMFYPTDNLHRGELLGYYRQREWRLMAGEINFNGHPMGRELSATEKFDLATIDPIFWNRPLLVEGKNVPRKDLALVYEPVAGWNAFDLVESVYAPQCIHARIKEILGPNVSIKPHP